MYCGNCGTELKSGDKICPKCGYLVLDTQQSSESPKVPSSITVSEIEASQKDTAPVNSTEQKKNFQSATKFKLMLVIAMACFFFPFITVSCAGEGFTASGYEAMIATSLSDANEMALDNFDFIDIKPNVYLVICFLMGAVGLALTKKEKSWKLPCVFSAGGFISLVLFRTNFYSFYSLEEYREIFSVKFCWGWTASLLFFFVATCIALSNCINSLQVTKQDSLQASQSTISSDNIQDHANIKQILMCLIGGIVLVAIIIGGWKFLTKPMSQDTMPRVEQGHEDSQDVIALEELSNAYYSNAYAADQKYAGQRLNVKGKIASIAPNSYGSTVSVGMDYVNPDDVEYYSPFIVAYFEFDSSNEALRELSVGSAAVISGYLEPDGQGDSLHFTGALLYGQEVDSSITMNTDGDEAQYNINESKTTIRFDTEFYSLELPDYWEDLCVYDQWDIEPYAYGITFYENQSLDDSDGDGGVLFSIALYSDEDYMDYPSYTYLGQLSVVRLATYDVVAIFPTDVQFSDAGQETYMKLSNDIDDILASFTPQPDVDCEYIPAN